MIPAALAIGAGLGILKSELIDRQKEARQRKLAAETARLSPWTGMTPQQVEETDTLGSALGFGATGAQLGAGMQDAALKEQLVNRYMQQTAPGEEVTPNVQEVAKPKKSVAPYRVASRGSMINPWAV